MNLIKIINSHVSDSQLKNVGKTVFEIKPSNQENKINVIFKNCYGPINNIVTSNNITVEKLLSKYLSIMRGKLDKSPYFYYNHSILQKNDIRKINELDISNCSIINVF